MKNKSINLNRLQLLKLATFFRTAFPTKKQFRYELLSSKSVILDEDLNVISNSEVGGIKLQYRIYTEVPRQLHLFGIKINLLPKIEKIETAYYYKPLKKYWPKEDNIPYEIIGKASSPFLGTWLRIKQDFNSINEEIQFLRIKEIITNKELSRFLTSKESTFTVLTNKFIKNE